MERCVLPALWRWGAALTVLTALACLPMMARAQSTSCLDDGDVMVEFLGVGTSNTILMERVDGAFQASVLLRVHCGLDGKLVPDARVKISTSVPNSSVQVHNGWQPATDPNFVEVSVPTGERMIVIRSSDPQLVGWRAYVGSSTGTVTLGLGGYPMASELIWAQTPELDSLTLFGSAIAGMAVLAASRLRRRRA